MQTFSKQAEYLSHAGKHDALLQFTFQLKLSALNLYVHGSQRANNVTNIKDLFQELSKCFMSQTGMNLQGCIEVKFKEGISEMMLGLIEVSLPTAL